MFDISPTEEVGDFEVKAKFMGVDMEKVQLHFQVNISQKCWSFMSSRSGQTVPFAVSVFGLLMGSIMDM